ncbi:MAG: alpha/beta fold hydrolase [Verrucomicrobiia bacterium]
MMLVSDGTNIHYEGAGTGRPIVLIPGWTMSTRLFDRNIPALATDHRVIAMNLRGHGQAEKVNFRHRMPRYSRMWLICWMHLSLKTPFSLAGPSALR